MYTYKLYILSDMYLRNVSHTHTRVMCRMFPLTTGFQQSTSKKSILMPYMHRAPEGVTINDDDAWFYRILAGFITSSMDGVGPPLPLLLRWHLVIANIAATSAAVCRRSMLPKQPPNHCQRVWLLAASGNIWDQQATLMYLLAISINLVSKS